MNLVSGVVSCVLMGVLMLAAIALLCCALLDYVNVWRAACEQKYVKATDSLFMSTWLFYLTAFVCLMSIVGLLLCL